MSTATQYHGLPEPNSTQVPDEFFDFIMQDLKEGELKVILFIIRRTYGFKKSSDSISLSQMTSGIRTRDGRVLCRGAGVSKKTLLEALSRLIQKGLVSKETNRS